MANGSYDRTGEGQTSWQGQTGARQTAEWAQSEARNITDRAREGMEQASGYVRDAMERTREKMAEFRDTGVEKVKDDVVNYTREQPVTALLIAAGAGLLIGWLTSMGRR